MEKIKQLLTESGVSPVAADKICGLMAEHATQVRAKLMKKSTPTRLHA